MHLLKTAGTLLQQGQGWSGLGGDGAAWVLAGLAAAGGRYLLVVDGPDLAERMVRALQFFHPEPQQICLFPADDGRPYDGFPPGQRMVWQRIRTLQRVEVGGPTIVVAAAAALCQRVPSRDSRRRGTRVLEPEQVLDRDDLRLWLEAAGYLATGACSEPGTFAVRGDVVDVWVPETSAPSRIDFFDDEIESIRRVDAATMRTTASKKRLLLLPAAEVRLDDEARLRAAAELSRLASEAEDGVRRRRQFLEDVRDGIRGSRITEWLPALVPTEAPLELLSDLQTVVYEPDDVFAVIRELERTAQSRYTDLDPSDRALVPPSERYVPAAEVIETLGQATPAFAIAGSGTQRDLGIKPVEGLKLRGTELAPVAGKLLKLAGSDYRVVLVVDRDRQVQQLEELLSTHGVVLQHLADPWQARTGKISVVVGDLPLGVVSKSAGWAVIPTSAIFGGGRQHAARRARLHALFTSAVKDISQLKDGDLVVHKVHGVGRYHGLVRLPMGASEQDFVKLEYRGDDTLFLPVAQLAMLSRYTSASQTSRVKLDKLGGQTWAARKGKVRDNLLGMAQELLKLYANRELAVREPIPPAGELYAAFENRFEHTETPDQAAAIDAVNADLERPFPMDRLVCGDVGFGKTEVAMRAACRMVEAGKQVVLLCPTTVLAYQHYNTFRERFEPLGIGVGMLSRFNTPAQEADTLERLESGALPIVVGTHAVLGRRVRYAHLGLAIIDEEHRFGVRQKDRLKKLRTEVDVLTMSATPIPRTLQMALSGARDLSIMATPPAERLAVATSMARLGRARVRDAILGELERGGQVFVIHNRVETIDAFTRQLQEWVPEARFATAHGQLSDEQLESRLVDFIEKRNDVLVCTSIVESGVDIPSVNTMLIDRADLFGLAQLYQLRGRVGRSSVRARCLLLAPEEITADARKRLRVLVENTQLGAGFAIASADLELRGGGNLLGKAQSGNIEQVGYDTWVSLLEEAVQLARGRQEVARIEPEVEVPEPAFIPDNLVSDMQDRLRWYQRIAQARNEQHVTDLLDELEEVVGSLPVQARNYGGLIQVQIRCRKLGVERCRWLRSKVLIDLHPASPLSDKQLDVAQTANRRRMRVHRKEGRAPTIELRFTPTDREQPYAYLLWALGQLDRAGS